MRSFSHRRRIACRPGLTLLEVMLAIAIFGGALVAIGELVRIGSVSAAAARDLTEAQRYCNNVMAEVSAGILAPDSTSAAEVEGAQGWLYSIEAEPLEGQDGLLTVTVTVEQDPALYHKPVTFTLVRWMTDPAAKEAAAAEAEASMSSTTSSSPATSGASTSASPAASSATKSGSSGSPTTGGQGAK
jgi:prepilin-type N-terminal cleavage/methylation domain-containing protein